MLPNFHAPKSGACQTEVYPASELTDNGVRSRTCPQPHKVLSGAVRGVVSQASQRARGFMTRHKLFKAIMDASLGSS